MSSLENRLKQALDEQAASLDAATLSRLHRARVQALETASGRWQRPFAWAATAATAVGVIAYLLLSQMNHAPDIMPATAAAGPVEIMEIMSLDDDLELVEDLDFYDWLEQQHQASDA